MTRLSLAVVFTALASLSLGASGREIYLTCSLVGPEGRPYQYSFAFDSEKATLFWVEGSQKFKVTRNTSTQLMGSHEMKFREFPHDETVFNLNRVTGAAEIFYIRKPPPPDIATCKKEPTWDCVGSPVLTEKSERGTCAVQDRVVR